MCKVLAICRISTIQQEIQSQIDELKSFIIADGIAEDDIIWLVGEGVSAIKEDDRFKANIAKAKEYISSGGISTVYAWEISRIGRRKVTIDLLIEDLVRHKVNLKIKQPSLTLLEPDGSVNAGMEIALTLFSSLAEQEMRLKKERFARAKKANSLAGKSNGGNTVPYGYYVDENNYFQPDKNQSAVVKACFKKYSTGKYSLSTLAKDMNELGHNFITVGWLHRVLSSTIYTGVRKTFHKDGSKKADRTYPRIISDELFNDVQEALKKNTQTKPRNYKHYYFGSRLMKCHKCGLSLIGGHQKYSCSCGKSHNISIQALDGLLWFISFEKETNLVLKEGKNQLKLYNEEIASRRAKIKSVDKLLDKAEKRLQRAKEAYLDALIDKDEYQVKVKSINDEIADTKNNVIRWNEEISKLNQLINSIGSENIISRMKSIMADISESDEKHMSDIVHKWVESVNVEGDGKVTVNTSDGRSYSALYDKNSKSQQWSTVTGQYLPIRGVVRDGDKCHMFNSKCGSNMAKAIDRKEQKIGINQLIENITEFWSQGR